VVDQRLTWEQDTRLRELIALVKQGQLLVDEQAEMEQLVDLVDHQMLLRSETLLLWQRRGDDIGTFLNPKQISPSTKSTSSCCGRISYLPDTRNTSTTRYARLHPCCVPLYRAHPVVNLTDQGFCASISKQCGR